MSIVALRMYHTILKTHYLLDVSQSESEAFYVVFVAGMHTVELIEDSLQIVFLYTYSVILYRDVYLAVARIPCAERQMKVHVVALVFYSIVHQVEDHS